MPNNSLTTCAVLVSLCLAVFLNTLQGQSFTPSNLNFNGNGGVSNSTSLEFGPDGKLYVLNIDGTINIFTVVKNAANDYVVTSSEQLSFVKNIPNHNDDGSTHSGSNREATGITVVGTAVTPVIYVTSSDSRIGGPSGDQGLDTNSGVITRLTKSGSAWNVVDIVRGLPRSEENHATNGLEFATVNGSDFLIVCSGGHTNAGSPSDNFAWTTEYALSAAILAVNLSMLEGMPILNDGRNYIYDIPTLDDPSRDNLDVNGNPASEDPDDANYSPIDIGDPWGGNDGLNQAMIVPGGPVQIFSPGFRNSYDLVLTESGAVYCTDNGANGGWGGLPANEGVDGTVTNDYISSEPGSSSSVGGEQVNNQDHLTMITANVNGYTFGSFYGGHPAPVRANPLGAGLFTNPTPNGVTNSIFRTQKYDPDASTANSTADASIALPANWPPAPVVPGQAEQGDWRAPGGSNPDGQDDILVTTWGTNTNGIDEYTASNFNGAMQGDLIAGKNGGVLRRVQLSGPGVLATLTSSFISGLGGNALGITCNGDLDPHPGTIWVATFNNTIKVLEPTDAGVCILPGESGYIATDDNDADGYSNQDEIDNLTGGQTAEDVICNPGLQPNDFDKDAGGNLISDLNDNDDDNDGILDHNDPFQIGDFLNGGSDAFELPVVNDLLSDNLVLDGYLGLGFTGMMNNGVAGNNWIDWIDVPGDGPNPNDLLGGAVGAMTMQMGGGTAMGATNMQRKAFQYGVQVDVSTGGFTIDGRIQNFNDPLQLYGNSNTPNGELGFYIGDGTQSNFIKLVLTKNGVTFQQEIADVPGSPLNVSIPTGNRPSNGVVFRFSVNPVSGDVTALYAYDGAPSYTVIGTITASGSVFSAVNSASTDLAIGLIGTSNNSGQELEGTWDYLNAAGSQPTIDDVLPDVNVTLSAANRTTDLDDFFNDNDGDGNLTYTIFDNTNNSIGANIIGSTMTLSFSATPQSSTITVRAADGGGLFVDQTFNVNVTDEPLPIARIRTNGATISATDAPNPDWIGITATGAQSGVSNNISFAVNAGNHSTHNITGRHASVPAYAPQELYASERWDPGSAPEMEFSFTVPNGDYVVRLYMGNGYDGTDAVGDRFYNINAEGVQVEGNFDPVLEFGHAIGGMVQHGVTVADGELNIDFEHVMENPLINAIEVLGFPITIQPIADQVNDAGDNVNLAVLASGGSSGPFSFAATGLPDGLQVEPTTGLIFGDIGATAIAGSPYTTVVTASKPNSISGSVTFTWTINGSVPQTWNEQSDDENHTARHECSFVQAGDKFYLFGGRENSQTLDVYDYSTKSWSPIVGSAPLEFNHFQAIEYKGLIWVICAFKDNGFPNEMPVENIWTYNPATDEWVMGPEIPVARRRGSAGVVVYNDKFYIAAGNQLGHNGQYVPWFDEFDPATGIWTELTSLDAPRSRDHFHAEVIGDKMYLAGGRRSGGPGGTFAPLIAEVDVYDFTTGSWTTLSNDLPTPRAAPSVASFQNKLYVIGGEIQDDLQGTPVNDAVKTTEIYDPATGNWTVGADLVTERHGTQAIVSGSGIHLTAGSSSLGGGGTMKNMEFLGIDNPSGTALQASTLAGPNSLSMPLNGTAIASLQNITGNTGLILNGTSIAGTNASEFSIVSPISYNLLEPGAQQTLTINHIGLTDGAAANLIINYDDNSVLNIPINAGGSAGVVEYRINAGGALTTANDIPNPDWEADQAGASAGGAAVTGSPSLYYNVVAPATDETYGVASFTGTNTTAYPDALFATERYSQAANPNNMQWDFPVPNGDYVINLIFAEVWTGAQAAGVRVFNVEIEDQLVLEDFDQTAEYGWNTAGVESIPISVVDGNLDINFLKSFQNPNIKAIEIIQAQTTTNDLPMVDVPTTQNNAEGDVVSLQVVATDVDPCTGLSYSATGLPPTLSINPSTGLISGTISESLSGGGAFVESGGEVIIEAETDFMDSPGGWKIIDEEGTIFMLAFSNHFGNTNGETVDYNVKISTPGVYRFHMKSEFTGTNASEENDTWFKIDNTSDVHFFCVDGGALTGTAEFLSLLGGGTGKDLFYPAGNAMGRTDHGNENPGISGFFKVYRSGGGGNKWDAKTIDNNGFPIYAYFPSAGTFQISMSERSAGHKVDRFALMHIDDVSTGIPTSTLDGSQSSQSAPGAADDSPYSVSVSVTDGCVPSLTSTANFIWNVFAAGANSLTINAEMQGRTDHSGTYQVQICEPGAGQMVMDVMQSAGPDGSITILNTPAGNYDILLKGNTYLAKAQTGITLIPGSNSLEYTIPNMTELRAGDANNSGAVSIADFSILAGTFNLVEGDSGYNSNADFNGSGAVSIADFSLLASNFNDLGDEVCVPASVIPEASTRELVEKLRVAPREVVNIRLVGEKDLEVREALQVEVLVDAAEIGLDGSDILVSYDPHVLDFLSLDNENGDLQVPLLREIDEEGGFIRIAAGSISGFKTGNLSLGSISFLASEAGETEVSIVTSSAVTRSGYLVERSTESLQITIIEPETELIVYPMPASNHITILLKNMRELSDYEVRIMSSSGALMRQSKLRAEVPTEISVSDWPAGLYLVKVSMQDETYYQKIIID